MSVDDVLAARSEHADDPDSAVMLPGLAHPRSSYAPKTQAYMLSTACLVLGNVMSAQLRATPAVQAYQRGVRALARLRAPAGSDARRTIADALISDLPARGNPRVRLARDQCIPPGALLTGGLGKAKI